MPGSLTDLLGVLGVAFLSALVPLINIEAYLGVRGSVGGIENIWLLGFAAGIGQMVGKVVWYYLGASSLSWTLGAQAARDPEGAGPAGDLACPHPRAPGRRGGVGVRCRRSAASRRSRSSRCSPASCACSLALFLGLGLLGRWLRFTAVLGGAEWLARLLH